MKLEAGQLITSNLRTSLNLGGTGTLEKKNHYANNGGPCTKVVDKYEVDCVLYNFRGKNQRKG